MSKPDIDIRLSAMKEFKAWKTAVDTKPLSGMDFVQLAGTPAFLFSYYSLFFPKLVEQEGFWFLQDRFDDPTFQSWKKELSSISDIQKVMNHIHVSSLVQNGDEYEELFDDVADILESAWSSTLPKNVSVYVDRADGATSVTFFQASPN